MKLNKELNIIGAIAFVISIFVGGSETGYINLGENIPGLVFMLFGCFGLLIQFVLLNISLAKKNKKNT